MTAILPPKIEAAWISLRNKVVTWVKGELVIVETTGQLLLAGVEAVAFSFEAPVVAEVKTVLQGIETDFLNGSTFEMIAEKVMQEVSADAKAVLAAANPQLVSALIGVLIHAL
jgi:hypothetical protein